MARPVRFDEHGTEEFAREWEALFDRGEYRAMADCYAEDATLIATGLETRDGRPAIEAFWREACAGAHAAGVTRTVQVERVECDHVLGYMRGTVSLQRRGAAAPTVVRYVTLWRRRPDGTWELIADISSVSPNGSER